MGDEGMIIEGGTGPTADIILSQIEFLGIDPARIKYIVLTHTHADHIGAVPRLRHRWPHLKILAGSIADKFLKRDNFVQEFLPSDKMIGKILIDRRDIESVPDEAEEYNFKADRILEQGAKIDLGDGITWEVFSTPGHSPCHISLFEEKEKNMAIGDITGYYDPDRDVFWPNYFQSLEYYCSSIKKMSSIPAERILLSHNGVIHGDGKRHMEKALKATEIFHQEIIGRLEKGEEKETICEEKADWICSLGALAYRNIIVFLCGLLVKNSLKGNNLEIFELPNAKAA
jgi:glyoxylase-like metal-dependent hydrolase (beta-lactamase superfamily II)